MTLKLQCPRCKHVTRLPNSAAGTMRRCLNCGAKMSVSMPEGKETEIPFADVADPQTLPMADRPIAMPSKEPQTSARQNVQNLTEDVADFDDAPTPPADHAESAFGNPFSSPHATSHDLVEDSEDPIDFSPDVSDIPDVPRIEAGPRNPALGLSSAQLRDVLRYASVTKAAANFVFAMLVISLVTEAFIVIVSMAALVRGIPPETHSSVLLSMGIHFAGGLICGVMAALTREYSLRLGDFLNRKRADDLVETFASASRFWQTSAVVMGIMFALTLVAIFAVVAWS